jgi:LuxR family maltose regulon positive regulatory protein
LPEAARRVHVVAATRSDPELPLERLRLAGRLRELRAADLAFSEEEAAALLAQLGVALRPEQVRTPARAHGGLGRRPALAGLSLLGDEDRDAFIADFAGDDRAVADYLMGEVLAGQPPELRELLLRTSIVERVSGELADALTGSSGGALALEQLERAGAFVNALDRQRTWYRYHGLFGELLRARLRLERPGLETELHARAAQWLAAAGLGREAIPHALAAGAAPRAPGRALARAAARRAVGEGRDRRRRPGRARIRGCRSPPLRRGSRSARPRARRPSSRASRPARPRPSAICCAPARAAT